MRRRWLEDARDLRASFVSSVLELLPESGVLTMLEQQPDAGAVHAGLRSRQQTAPPSVTPLDLVRDDLPPNLPTRIATRLSLGTAREVGVNVHVGTTRPHGGEQIVERDRRSAHRGAIRPGGHHARPAGLAGAGRLRITRSTQVQPHRAILAGGRNVNVPQNGVRQIGAVDGIRDLAAADGNRGCASRGRGYRWNLVGPGFIPPPFIGWSLGASTDTLGGQVQPVLYRDSLLGAV